jgi:hypothetical protein
MDLDLRLKATTPDHPKIQRLIAELGYQAYWSLTKLWGFTRLNHPNGILTRMDGLDIALASGWSGADADRWVETLKRLRLLNTVRGANSYEIHDWPEHQPWAITDSRRTIAAKVAAAQRWEKKEVRCERNADAYAKSNAPNLNALTKDPLPNQDLDQNLSRKSRAHVRPKPPDGFSEFWSAYPRKVGKGAAEKAWTTKVNGDGPAVMTALSWQIGSTQHLDRDPQYIPHPATWLNQRRWEDPQPKPYDPGDF